MSLRATTFALMIASSTLAGGCSTTSDGGKQSTSTSSTSAAVPHTAKDERFMQEAARMNRTQIEIGRLATMRGSTRDVREYGERLVREHTRMNGTLQEIASNKGITLPTRTDSKGDYVVRKLEALNGEAFDRALLDHVRMDHARVTSLLRDEAQETNDPALRAWAEQMEPIVDRNRQVAVDLRHEGPAMGQ